MLRPDADPDPLVAVLDVPITLSGLSRHNVANALAAAAAGLGLGLDREAVVDGLRTFLPDVRLNPGRMNVWTIPLAAGAVTVVIDLAHNEAGLEALLDVCEGLRMPGAQLHLGLGTAGDRTEELMVGLGEIAGRRADDVAIVHKERYLRGRTREDLEASLRAGLGSGGHRGGPSFPDELSGLQGLLARAVDGDVVAVMCHADRPLLDEWLLAEGATPDGPDEIRAKVVAARGEHPQEEQIAALWAHADPTDRQRLLLAMLDADPDDPRLMFEWASALDAAGHEAEAVPAYRAALRDGLREPHRHRAMLQLGSSLTVLGRVEEALEVLSQVREQRPDERCGTRLLRPGAAGRLARRPGPGRADGGVARARRRAGRPGLPRRAAALRRRGAAAPPPRRPASGRPPASEPGRVQVRVADPALRVRAGLGLLPEPLELGEHAGVLVRAQHDQVAPVGPGHAVPDRIQLVGDHLDLLAARALGHPGPHALGDQLRPPRPGARRRRLASSRTTTTSK